MVILATNIERVEGENGLDELLLKVKEECKRQGVPLVICMSRSQLGFTTKFAGQRASIVGVFNY